MNLIDDKGRLFGKLNLFDLVVFLLILLTIITAGKLLFFNNSLRILVSAPASMPKCWPGETPNIENGTLVNITVTLLSTNQPEWFEKAIIPGDTTWFGDKHQARILEKTSILCQKDVEHFYDIQTKFQLRVLKKEGNLLYEGTKIKINEPFRITMSKINIDGLIINISEDEN